MAGVVAPRDLAVPLVVAAACLLAGTSLPVVSPLVLALVVGAVVANLDQSRPVAGAGQTAAARLLLRWGVVLVGLRLSLEAIGSLGLTGIVIVVATVALTFSATCAVGDRLGLDRGLVTLVAAGFSVCGAAAVAAVEGGVRRRPEHVALAVAMVTVFGTLMIPVVVLLGGALGMSDHQRGVWAGASIHEVAQVVAAASVVGTTALAVATTVKLGRVVTLAVVYVAAAGRERSASEQPPAGRRPPRVPWFVAGFLLAAAVRSTGLVPHSVLGAAEAAATVLLAAGMYGLGLGLRLGDLLPLPPRLVLLCSVSTTVAAGVPLALVLLAG